MSAKNNVVTNLVNVKMGAPGYVHSIPLKEGGTKYTILIAEPVMDSLTYVNLISVLNHATAKDEVHIKLASPGGDVMIGMSICNAMHNSKAKIFTQAIGMTASIAAVIWCCGKSRSITPTATLMFHMTSCFDMGKTADVIERSQFFEGYFKEMLGRLCASIMTKEEFEDMTNNRRDIFLPYDVLKTRLTKKEN
jgi:ATP-dependent protease ClpP protease subunit